MFINEYFNTILSSFHFFFLLICLLYLNFRQQQFSTCSFEPVDELSVIGHLDVPDLNSLFEQFESNGYVYVHQFCATWTQGVKCDTADSLENVPELILESLMRRCTYCGHLGASAPCTYSNCLKFFHYPCIFASASFQEMSVPALICNSHLDHVPLMGKSNTKGINDKISYKKRIMNN